MSKQNIVFLLFISFFLHPWFYLKGPPSRRSAFLLPLSVIWRLRDNADDGSDDHWGDNDIKWRKYSIRHQMIQCPSVPQKPPHRSESALLPTPTAPLSLSLLCIHLFQPGSHKGFNSPMVKRSSHEGRDKNKKAHGDALVNVGDALLRLKMNDFSHIASFPLQLSSSSRGEC